MTSFELVSRDALVDKVGACRLRGVASSVSIYREPSLGHALFRDLGIALTKSDRFPVPRDLPFCLEGCDYMQAIPSGGASRRGCGGEQSISFRVVQVGLLLGGGGGGGVGRRLLS